MSVVTVVLIEEDQTIRSSLQAALAAACPGVSTTEVTDAGELAGVLAGPASDLVIVSEDLGFAPSAEVLRRVRDRWDSAAVLLRLREGTVAAGLAALEAGFDDCFGADEVHRPRLTWVVRAAFERRAGVAARQHLEVMAREVETRIAAVLETAAQGVVAIDRSGTIEFFNRAAEVMFGYSRGEVIGRNVSVLMPEPHRSAHDGFIRRYLQTGRAQVIGTGREVRGTRKDGTEFPIDLALSEASVGGRRVFTGFLRDLTERRALEDEVRQLHKLEAVGRLAGGVAHDFNNLLTAILGYCELMLLQIDDDHALRADIAEVQLAAERAAALTRQLLMFSRRHVVRFQWLDLNSVIDGLCRTLRRLVGEHVRLDLRLASELGVVRADPGLMEQVLAGLVMNARDAMPNGGSVTIATDEIALDDTAASVHPELPAGRYVRLSVADDGLGMPPDVKARAFEPFFSTKGLGAGTGVGLGLSTVFGVVKQCGGSVRIESRTGGGTTVEILLPAVDRHASLPDPESPSRRSAGGNETVLVAEDEAPLRVLAAEALRREGYTVLEAPDGTSALERAAAHSGELHLLLTDVTMPGLTGPALARALVGQRPGLRVLFMSGYTDDALGSHGVLESGTPFISKPFTPRVLARAVRDTLDRPPFKP